MVEGQREQISPFGRFTTRGVAVRLFLTCWVIYSMHLATNTVREIYLALAIGDHLSFRVDEYANMHPDLFEKEGYGWHIGANPGASMLGAIPYAVVRPAVDILVNRVNQGRAGGQAEPPVYDSPWPMAREFYREAWRRGLDVKFGIASVVMQSLCMAPLSALAAVAMFFLLRSRFGSDKLALGLALLFAFATPVFFRTGYLNQNLLAGHFSLFGFLVLYNPGELFRWSERRTAFAGGLAGGVAVLLDYSGAVTLLMLFAYGLWRWRAEGVARVIRSGAWYVLGSLGPILLLWFYQWRSFGHPIYPGQHWMPPVEWIELGYQGLSAPQLELLAALALDYRFGLFVTCPLLLLALAAPLLDRGPGRALPPREVWFLLGFFLAYWIFFSGVNYTRLQYNTGIRYLAPVFWALFVPTAAVLIRLPSPVRYLIAVAALAQAWCMAMYRDVERGLGVLDPILHVLLGGFQLPVLTVLSRMGDRFGSYFERGVSPLVLFVLAGAVLFGIWSPRTWPWGLRGKEE